MSGGDTEQFLQLASATCRAQRRFFTTDQKFELLVALVTLIFKDGHVIDSPAKWLVSVIKMVVSSDSTFPL
jgi:hypothetical protein